MTNPTTNYGWVMPSATDLVTDLPADFEVFGQAVDTDFVDLLGGANGYILSKASAADLDFTWIANDQGDITGITATSPLTGGGSSGAITVGIQDASTAAKGSVQLSDSTSTTSSVLASTPTATKSAYDLADAAIPKSLVTTAGDVIYRDATVPVRLGIGTAGQVLTVNGGATAPEWAAATAGGKVLQVVSASTSTGTNIATTTMTDTTITATITPTLATSKVLAILSVCVRGEVSTGGILVAARLLRGATNIADYGNTGSTARFLRSSTSDYLGILSVTAFDSPNTTSATTYKLQAAVESTANSQTAQFQLSSTPSTITLLEIGA